MLALHKLENVSHRQGKISARCPACAAADGDTAGRHLVIWTNSGKFACAANPGDREHRRLIWELAGDNESAAPLSAAARRLLTERRNREATERRYAGRLNDAATREKAAILRNFAWPLADVAKESPVRLDSRRETDWRYFIPALWPADAVIWIGEFYHSGKCSHARHFRTIGNWLTAAAKLPRPPWPLTCPDTFKAGVVSRASANVAESPFIVVEADDAIGYKPVTPGDRAANIVANLALIHWLRDACSWLLRAIIFTGNKSCHGWFDRPPAKHIEELKIIAPAWGLDSSVFSIAHPVRLPGVRHKSTGQVSRCLYLAPSITSSP